MAKKKKSSAAKKKNNGNGQGIAIALGVVAIVLTSVMWVRANRAQQASIDGGNPSAQGSFSDRENRIAERFPRIKSRFWMGVRCRKSGSWFDRKSNDQKGLTVKRVFRYTPAYMAGFKKYDVLLSFNGKPLNRVRDLGKAVGHSKDQAATVDILRDGKHMSLTVTPMRWYLGRRMDFKHQYYSQGYKTARTPAPTTPVIISSNEKPLTEEI